MSKVKKELKNLAKCQCGMCPSFNVTCKLKAVAPDLVSLATGISKAEHFEGMFCAYEKSNCIHEEHGCKCMGCPVAEENHLHHDYYCTHNISDFPDDQR